MQVVALAISCSVMVVVPLKVSSNVVLCYGCNVVVVRSGTYGFGELCSSRIVVWNGSSRCMCVVVVMWLYKELWCGIRCM